MEINFDTVKDHVLRRIRETEVCKIPFYHVYIGTIFPANFYNLLKDKMLYHKYNSTLEPRNWDNPNYVNKRYSLKDDMTPVISTVKKIFSDPEVQAALLEKFYITVPNSDIIEIVRDMQFVYTGKDRFQTIHTDIYAQFVSLIFYMPEDVLSSEEERDNGTILYNKKLEPCKVAAFRENSMCCFAPHFYSYHGFNTTISNRNTLLFFMAHRSLLGEYYHDIRTSGGIPVPTFKSTVAKKLREYNLHEYNILDLQSEHDTSLVNTLNGRVAI